MYRNNKEAGALDSHCTFRQKASVVLTYKYPVVVPKLFFTIYSINMVYILHFNYVFSQTEFTDHVDVYKSSD